jgi:hypothetical protein
MMAGIVRQQGEFMTNEQIEQLVQFITEQQAVTSQAVAKLSLDSIARSADIDKNTADITRLAEVVEKNSADIEKLTDRLDLVIRVVELQAKLQDGNQMQFKQFQEQLKQLTEKIEEVARLIEQSFKRSRNGDSN